MGEGGYRCRWLRKQRCCIRKKEKGVRGNTVNATAHVTQNQHCGSTWEGWLNSFFKKLPVQIWYLKKQAYFVKDAVIKFAYKRGACICVSWGSSGMPPCLMYRHAPVSTGVCVCRFLGPPLDTWNHG